MMSFQNNWIVLLVSGIFMVCLSQIIFGGVFHAFMIGSEYSFRIYLLIAGSFSTLVSGVLMLYDSMKVKIKNEMKRKQKGPVLNDEHIKKHIKFLSDECEKVRPEKIGREKREMRKKAKQ